MRNHIPSQTISCDVLSKPIPKLTAKFTQKVYTSNFTTINRFNFQRTNHKTSKRQSRSNKTLVFKFQIEHTFLLYSLLFTLHSSPPTPKSPKRAQYNFASEELKKYRNPRYGSRRTKKEETYLEWRRIRRHFSQKTYNFFFRC